MPRNAVDYEEDFYAWTMEQAQLLRSGEFSELDIENIAEELETMGRSDKREIESRLTVLLAHLLKWQLQVGLRSKSWSGTIREQRREGSSRQPSGKALRQVLQSIPALLAARRHHSHHGCCVPAANFPAAYAHK